MSFRSRYDKDGSSQRMGDRGELNFAIEATKRGCDPVKTGTAEDKRHVDWHLTLLNKRTTCDSKAHKAMYRGGPPQDDWILLEDKNVAGNAGWIHGEADYISFEQSDCYIIVPRTELVKLWNEIVDTTILAHRAEEAKGIIYQRRDRLDVISYVKNTDVKKRQGVIIWEKNKNV
jgi:hypothetical protein